MERLARRLRWERTGAGVRVEVPARRSWQAVVATVLFAGWTGIPCVFLYRTTEESRGNVFLFALTCLGMGALGTCAAVAWTVWTWAGESVVALDPRELRIERRVAGFGLDARRFSNAEISGLRFIPAAYIWAFRTDADPATTRMEFKTGRKTVRFARGITEREAVGLVDCLAGVYRFPVEGAAGGVEGR